MQVPSFDRLARLARSRARTVSTRTIAGLSFAFGSVLFVLGAVLIERKANTLAGSPPGWILVTAGICLVLAAVGLVAGVYED